MKKYYYLLLLAVVTISCDNVYFKNRNPAHLPAISLPQEFYGEYTGAGDTQLTLTATQLDLTYDYDGSLYTYKGEYGANSEMPVFKIGDSYMLSYNDPEINDYYRIFLFDYQPRLGQIIVKEIFGTQKTQAKKASLSKIPSARMLTDPQVAADGLSDVEYLVDPSPNEFINWVNIDVFEEVALFQKRDFECQEVEYFLEYSSYDDWIRCEASSYNSEVQELIEEQIEYYKGKRKPGAYEFAIYVDNSRRWFRVNISCAGSKSRL